MRASKLQLKIFLTPETSQAASDDAFIGVFHAWIRERRLPELLVDVANYAHVPDGPGVVIIGHGSDYSLDRAAGRAGLLHNRKRAGTAPERRLADLARRTLFVADLLEKEPTLGGHIRFATDELLFRVNDRLEAPNDDQTWAAVGPELTSFAETLFGCPFTAIREGAPRELFAVRLKATDRIPLATLLTRAGGPPEPDAV